jgi:5-methylcytosine-specific restriction protein A
MPARSVCSTPGCPVLVYPSGRCAECRAKAAAMRTRTARKGYGSQWQRTRARFLAQHPYCECAQCGTLPVPLKPRATEVDHIDGLGPLGPRGYDWTNLRAMTKAHHARETARNQPGGWNDRG